ncbi:MAG TPA: hypothetical protein VFO34_12150 [Candidatus Acidoferrales bacterium]|nr:hypothetical protein [Candidatus Acidoferrales bacterium]
MRGVTDLLVPSSLRSWAKRFLPFAVLTVALPAASFAARQQTTQSVAEAARRAREQKKQEAASGKVWTNENVPTSGTGISVVGEAPAAPATDAATKPGDAAASTDKPNATSAPAKTLSPEEITKKRADLQAELEEARKDQERLEKELDLAKRDLDLQSQQAYSSPMAVSNSSAIDAQLQPYRESMNSKADALDKAKAKIADLQKQLDELQQQ